MAMPVRTPDGNLVGKTVPYIDDGSELATVQTGDDVPGPIRTGSGEPVGRTALYEVQGDVAVPITQLGSDVGTDLTAEPPLQMTNDGDGKGTISIDTDVAGGVPTLDQNTLLRLSQMPIDGLNYHGAWDASTNTPTLADGEGTAGDMYRVSVAGSQDLGSGSIDFAVGDHVLYEGAVWQQLAPPQVIDWGDIEGTLANQADLQAALDAKVAKTGDTMTGPLNITATASIPLSTTNTGTGGAGLLSVADNGAAAASGDRLGYKLFGGATDDQHSIYHSSGAEAFASEDWSAGAAGTALRFDVTPNGTVARITAMEIHNDGTVDVKSGKIVAVADGTDPHDAVNRQQLDAKADSADVPAAADPSAQVGLAATNGSAATFMRSDGAPALDQSIAPTWTGAHEFQAAATETAPSVGVASTNPQLELRRTNSDADEKRWNFRAFPDQLALRALTDAGDVADNAWLITRSGGTVTAHSLQAGGNALLELSAQSDIIAFVALHMSSSRIMELGDPQHDTDAVNRRTLQAAIDALATVASSGNYSDLSGRPIVRDSGTVALHLAGEELLWPVDVSTGKIRLYNTTPSSDNTYYGLGVTNQTFVYQVDGSGSAHTFQSVDGSDNAVVLLEISDEGGIVAHRNVHMSEQKIHNVGDPDSARDAANKQYVDNAVAGVGSSDTMDVQAHNDPSVTLSAGDPRVQLCDAFGMSNPVQVALPDNPPTGTVFTVKLVGAADQNVVISNPSATIDGQDSASLSTLNDFITVVYDGQHWQIIATS